MPRCIWHPDAESALFILVGDVLRITDKDSNFLIGKNCKHSIRISIATQKSTFSNWSLVFGHSFFIESRSKTGVVVCFFELRSV